MSSETRHHSFFTYRENIRWPNPDESIGEFFGKKYGRLCWQARGPAHEAFKEIGPTIKKYLTDSCATVPHSPGVTWSIYMIGKSKSTAVPTIMFECLKKDARKEVMDQVRDSGILNKYPGIKTGHWDSPPHIIHARPLSLICRKKSSQRNVQSSRPTHSSGAQIIVRGPSNDLGVSQKATLGGVIQLNGKSYYFTANHPFSEFYLPQSTQTNLDEDNCEYDFGDQDEAGGEDFNKLFVDAASEGKSNLPKVMHESNSDISDIIAADNSAFSVRDIFIGSTTLDYALIEISDDDVVFSSYNGKLVLNSKQDIPIICQERVGTIVSEDVPIVTSTGTSGSLSGTLFGLPAYTRLPGSTTYQEVFTVRIDGPLNPGDSGSCIFDAKTGALYGHIVAGSPATQTAYIVPATSVFQDITLRKKDMTLQSRSQQGNSPSVQGSVPREPQVSCRSNDKAGEEVLSKDGNFKEDMHCVEMMRNTACETTEFNFNTSHSKTWQRLFSWNRNFKEDMPFVDVKRDMNTNFDGLDIFLQDSEYPVPSQAAEDIRAFCEGATCLDDLRSGSGTAGKRPAAWLNDRKKCTQLHLYTQRTASGISYSRVCILRSIGCSQEGSSL